MDSKGYKTHHNSSIMCKELVDSFPLSSYRLLVGIKDSQQEESKGGGWSMGGAKRKLYFVTWTKSSST